MYKVGLTGLPLRVRRMRALAVSGACLLFVGVPAFQSAAHADEVSDLRSEMKRMAKRLERLEHERRPFSIEHPVLARTPGTYIDPHLPSPPGRYTGYLDIPGTNTSISLGGSLRADMYYNFHGGPIGGVPGTDFRGISLSGSAGSHRGGSFDFSPRLSQLTLRSITPTSFGDLTTFVSVDFAGQSVGNTYQTNSFGPRLREAYGVLHQGDNTWLVGHTWSTFMDLTSYPETLDNNGPVGPAYIRQPMIRYIRNLGGGSKVYLAVESAYSDFEGAVNQTIVGGTDIPSPNYLTPIPDVVAKYTYDANWGHIAVAGVGRLLDLDTGGVGLSGNTAISPVGVTGTKANPLVPGHRETVGGGGLLGASIRTIGKDSINAQIVGGSGLGRYDYGDADNRAGASLTFCNATDTVVCGLRNITSIGGGGSYQHYWMNNLRSNFVVGYMEYLNGEFPDNPSLSTKNIFIGVYQHHLGALSEFRCRARIRLR